MSDSGFNEGSGSQAENFSDTMSMDSVMSSASTSTLTEPGPSDSDPHTQLPVFDHMAPPSLDSGRGSSLSGSARSGQTAIPHAHNVEAMSSDSGISSGRNGSKDTRMDTRNLSTERVDTQSRTEKLIQERSLMPPPSLDRSRGSSLSSSARSGQTHERGFHEGSSCYDADVSDTMSTDAAMSIASTSTLTGPGASDPHTQVPGRGILFSGSARSGQTAIPHGNNGEEISSLSTERVDTQSRTEKWIEDQKRSLMPPPSLDSGRGSSLSSSARSGQTAIPHGPGASGPHTQVPGFGQMAPPGLDSGKGSSLSHSARSGQTAIPHGNNVEEMSLDSGISSGRNGSLDTRMDTSNLSTERVDTQSRTVKRVQESQFDVFVVNFDGKKHTVRVDENEDVRSFKQKVAQKLGVPEAQQRLTTQAGKTLEAGQTLKACNVTKHSTIYCQGRLRGGSMTGP